MKFRSLRFGLTAASLSCLLLVGCQHSTTAVSPSLSPLNEKERLQQERWEAATQGLEFDSRNERVRVKRIPSGSQLVAAQHLVSGNSLLAENRIVDAMEQYALAARNAPDSSEAYMGMGLILRRKGRLPQAVAAYRTAIELAPNDEGRDARFELARTLWSADRRDEAMTEMQRLVDEDPDHAGGHERLAVWSYYDGEYANAWFHLHRADELGRPVPAQLVPSLEARMPDPGPVTQD